MPGQALVQYKAEIADGRPKRLGFGATDGYTIGLDGDSHTRSLVQANEWVRGPYWFRDREDAERYESANEEERKQWLVSP